MTDRPLQTDSPRLQNPSLLPTNKGQDAARLGRLWFKNQRAPTCHKRVQNAKIRMHTKERNLGLPPHALETVS